MGEKLLEKHWLTKLADTLQPFGIGGLSGCVATCFVQPVDLVKVRIQLKSEKLGPNAGSEISPFRVFSEILKEGGVLSFWKGIDSALARQVFYTTTRMGIYKTMYLRSKQANNGKEPSFLAKSWCSIVAGFLGSLAGNPADLALVRIQADSTLPVEERRGYKNVFDAFYKIVKDEGVVALWRGSTPTVIRAIVINVAMLGPYDEIKEQLNHYFGTKDTQQTRLLASAAAGFLSSFCALPFDNAKTKMQKMKKDAAGVYPYSSIFDAMGKTVKREGIIGLWVGFPTFYFRIAPHTMITLLTQDWLTDKVNTWRKKKN
ncbi:unnamed protein product (macronuclear) [Paramecium tetraurelia]|uniref:Uncharacterized protein n=1 Tax=Paramecium tetraurelia TaxID=5888 RepID=A0DGY7_PARTE|nr:uncharacterized protein GSPATT00002433001 [Paramecium tetraurelia]CAK82304.1 unnamed protein product [Paramecium tetraurelia]|eukprot:XP_001449701.1 hypothetical protein (macronuclear) [Paramecium tetraurelia strain d4-2]